MSTPGAEPAVVLALLRERLAGVLGLPVERITAGSRLDEDLHADSLDVVETITAVEQTLRQRGVVASVPDPELVALRTVGDAANRIAASARVVLAP